MSWIFAVICCFILFFFGNMPIYAVVYACTGAFLLLRLFISSVKLPTKIYLAFTYSMIIAVQQLYNSWILFQFDFERQPTLPEKGIGIFLLLFPFVIEKFLLNFKSAGNFFPSVQDLSTVTFDELRRNKAEIFEAVNTLKHIGKAVSVENVREIFNDLPRHSSTRYINKESLSEEYFNTAYSTLEDQHIYIVISSTGSHASEFIGIFTNRAYNHASLSFDRDLKTVVSYNGGEKIYPPGLNYEDLKFFNKKKDASIIVYRLSCTKGQKKKIIDTVKEINTQGSAYNILGLILKFSFSPNIMYCSQFVYKMLKIVDLAYFTKNEGDIQPMDLVELDYERKLEYVYTLTFK
ncbi:hypothetical protein [Marispirochaeta aestuarii]|uniref:hypothetical protein n=1 Tax=Marispirochaeta aestuarii TaxID=1963862 RepID=UPI0029C8EC69|nr:hypothetical protein [Marispirochaeta aestuarii]